MKLEDFFKKKDQPVMVDPSFFPEPGQITMDVVEGGVPVKTKSPVPVGGKVTVPTPGIGIDAPISKKVPEETVKQIQRDFSTQPPQVMAESSESTTLRMPMAEEPKELDYKKIRETASKASDITDTDLLVGLVPLLTSVIAGGRQGEGVDVSGKYYTNLAAEDKKRQRTLEERLLDIEKSRATALAKKSTSSKLPTASNLVPVVGDDGVVRYEWAASAAGKEKPSDVKKGLTLEDRLSLQQKSQEFKKEQEDRRLAKEAGARFQTKLESDPIFKDFRQQATQSQRALDLLSKGVGVADAGARTTFAKGIFGEVGNLAIQEQMAVSGSPAISQKYETLWDKWTKGTLGNEDRADMVEVALAIRENAPKVLSKIASQKAEAEKQISGIDVSSVASALSKDVTTGKVKVKVIYKGRVKNIDIEDYPKAVRDFGAKLYTGKE